MPTYNENILPSSTGFDLGNSTQRWDVFAQNLDAMGTNFQLSASAYGSIQAAHDALPATGGEIYVSDGTYAPATITKSNVTIRGAGVGAIITTTGNADFLGVNGASHVDISNLKFIGTANDQPTTQTGVRLYGNASDVRVHDNWFSGSSVAGLKAAVEIDSGSNGNFIVNNTVDSIFGTYASGGGYGFLVVGSHNLIEGNHCDMTGSNVGRHHVYLSSGASYNRVANNYLSGGSNDQIVIYAFTAQSASVYNEIIGNILLSAAAGSQAAISITENCNYNRVESNQIINAGAIGILLMANGAGSNAHADENYIVNNTVFHAGTWGIQLAGTSRSLVQGNVVNDCGQLQTTTYSGIQIQSAAPNGQALNNRIIGNYVYGSGKQRFAFSIDAGLPAVTGTAVSGNSFSPGVVGETASDGGASTVWGLNDLNGVTSAKSQITSAVVTGTAPLVVASTTPVANLTCTPITYSAAGVQRVGVHAVTGQVTLAGGTATVTLAGAAVFTANTTYFVTATNNTAPNAIQVVQTDATHFTLSSSGATDVVNWIAIGN